MRSKGQFLWPEPLCSGCAMGLALLTPRLTRRPWRNLQIVLRTLSLCPLLLGLVRRIGTPTVAVRLLG